MIHREKIGRKVLVVGGANVDLQGIAFSAFVPGDSNPGRIFSRLGWVGRNIAENCARLGLSHRSSPPSATMPTELSCVRIARRRD